MWTKRFPKNVGYYWQRSESIGAPVIVEISGGAPGVETVVYFHGVEPMSKRKFQRENPRSEFYGPLEPPTE